MRYAAALLALVLSAGAFASTTTTATPGDWVLRNPDNSPIVGLTKYRFPTEQECLATAGQLKAGKYKCDHSVALTVVATCTDERAPHIPLTRNTSDPKLWDEPPARAVQPDQADDSRWDTVQWLYVRNPAGLYPNCWIRGDANPAEWCVNGADPNAPFMQRTDEPGACPETPNSVEVVTWPQTLVAARLTPESCATRHEACVIYPKGSPEENCGAPPAKCAMAENFYQ